jgi:uncharacterized protein
MLPAIEHRIARQLDVPVSRIESAIRLLDEGATVPFIARYRKEATGSLDDTQLRTLAERLDYLRGLEDRRVAILESIAAQGKLSDALRAGILGAETKQELEDLYLPYKPKRRTKAQIAREAGIEPLADLLLGEPTTVPDEAATVFLNPGAGFADVKAVLDGARQILMERFAEDATLVATVREYFAAHAILCGDVVAGKEQKAEKYRDYHCFRERWSTVPSHRILALLRARNEGMLQVSLALDSDLAEDHDPRALNPCEVRVANHAGIRDEGRPADAWLRDTARWTWKVKLALQLEIEFTGELRERAEREAIRVFGKNLKDLLLAAPAGPRPTLGLDPGIRTGVKVAAVDATGKLVATDTIYPHEPRRDWNGSIARLAAIAATHRIELVAIGNGTASRETEKLVGDLMARHPELRLTPVVVSEAGASVYSASELAAREFPTLDVSLRGAVSIARRLQDPLAELVKIDPKSIGVGQYQHDVSQTALARALDDVVEDCVNAVGVNVNTASAPLLARVSGLSPALAEGIVGWRDANGPFPNRAALRAVPRLGEKTFEQAAGFLRIPDSDNPLDASGVHPESYPVVERILVDLGRPLRALLGDNRALKSLEASRYADERFGLPTVQDILRELEKPGRDPRPQFRTAKFNDQVREPKDLTPGMLLEGTVTNVAAFGAFVDVGVHQDGLVHVSALADRFVRDPRDVVKVGDVVRVRVVAVDLQRQRIALTMRLNSPPEPAAETAPAGRPAARRAPPRASAPTPTGAMAAAFARLKP